MDRPQELIDYRALVIEKNKIESKIKKLRPVVGNLLTQYGDYDDLWMCKVVKPQWHEDIIYDWVKESYPELVDEISKVTVDIEKFSNLVKAGRINPLDVPSTISTDKVEWHVKTTPKAKEVESEDSSIS